MFLAQFAAPELILGNPATVAPAADLEPSIRFQPSLLLRVATAREPRNSLVLLVNPTPPPSGHNLKPVQIPSRLFSLMQRCHFRYVLSLSTSADRSGIQADCRNCRV